MGKRGADKQLTQLDQELDNEEEPSSNVMPQASANALSQRKIKGLPSRKSNTTVTSIAKAASPDPPAQNGTKADEEAKERYINQRGLNISLLSTLTDLVKDDAFIDLSEHLSQITTSYKSQRQKMDGGNNASSLQPTLANGTSSNQPTFTSTAPTSAPSPFSGFNFVSTKATPAPSKSAEKVEEPPKASLPTPPASFSFGGQTYGNSTVREASSSAPISGGFVFDPSKSTASEKSTFSFPPAAQTTQKSTTEQSAELQTKKEAEKAPTVPSLNRLQSAQPVKPSPLRTASTLDSSPIASPPSSLSQPKTDPPASPSPSFSASEDKPKANPFAAFAFNPTPASTPTDAAPPKPAFSFGSASTNFGQPAATAEASKAPAFSFNASAVKPSGSLFSFSPAPTSTTLAGDAENKAAFGRGKTSTPSVGFSFGMSSNSAPTTSTTPSFSFGGSAPSKDAPSTGFSFGAFNSTTPKPAFSFNPPVKAAEATEDESSNATGEETRDATPAPVEDGENPLLAAGQGEENEDTINETRAKLFHFDKEARSWESIGVGSFKVKQNKETGKCRLLGRHTTNGKVIMNFLLYPELKITVMPKTLAFMAFDNGEAQSVRLKVKDDNIRDAMKEAIESKLQTSS